VQPLRPIQILQNIFGNNFSNVSNQPLCQFREGHNKEESQGFRIAYFSPKESNQVEHSDPIVK